MVDLVFTASKLNELIAFWDISVLIYEISILLSPELKCINALKLNLHYVGDIACMLNAWT